MKIKEIVLREEQTIQGKITNVKPSTNPSPKPGEMEVTMDTPQGPVTANVNTQDPTQVQTSGSETIVKLPPNEINALKIGNPVTVQTTPSSTTSTTSTPPTTTTTPTTNTTTTPPTQLTAEEIDEEDPNEFSDSELIRAATHKGMDDSLEFDDDGVLANRDEIIDLLQNGQEFGGDPTDDFIDDVEDDEYDQLLEKIKQLSGL